MIPPRRFDVLLEQAREFQRHSCVYHNTSAPFSLYTDHACGRESFPGVTTLILAEHEDEVWDLQWSHNGCYLATASSDQTAIIWRIGVSRIVLRIWNHVYQSLAFCIKTAGQSFNRAGVFSGASITKSPKGRQWACMVAGWWDTYHLCGSNH